MIVGTVSPDGLPTLALPIAGQTWNATIDTGFNGDLELPEALRVHVNPRWAGVVRSLLAAGQIIDEDYYLVEFPFDGRVVVAEASFTEGDDILIGTRLLQDYRLEINFVTKRVELERLIP